jgi:hypothetical protein
MENSPNREQARCKYCDFQARAGAEGRSELEKHCKEHHPEEWNRLVDNFLTEFVYRKEPRAN